ncbi:MAG: galactose oxidase-like domain-containing protein [Pseudomonadota bacterium]
MRVISALGALVLVMLAAPIHANEEEGRWSEVYEWPVTAIHMSLLHTGHVLLWSVDDDEELIDTGREGYGEPYLLDPTGDCFDVAAGCFTPKPNPVNIFCGGHAQLSDGSLLVNGGHVRDDVGFADTFLFRYDRELNDWNWTPQGALPNSHFARWYSTLTTLPDGRVLNVSGSEKRCGAASANADELCEVHTDCGTEEQMLCEVRLVAPPEVFDPATREWTLIDTITDAVQYYPFNFVAPDGRVFFAGADVGAETIYTPSTEGHYFDLMSGDSGSFDATGESSAIDGGSAVMYRPGQILKCGGTDSPDDPDQEPDGIALSTAEIINLNVSDQWTGTGDMNIPRRRHNLTVLPDGTVLATGGTRLWNREFTTDATCGGTIPGTNCATNNNCDGEDEGLTCDLLLEGEQRWIAEAEIWDPDTGTWTTMAAAARPRLYHSSALLLPDGRVVSAGGGPRGFGRAIRTYTGAQVYSPPYLYRDSERPVIDDAPEIIYYGNSFEVRSAQAHDVSEVNLVRLGAVTHSFDQNTRFVPLSFTSPVDEVLDVQAPPNGNIAPPGYYMLFLISSDGYPSVARFVRILEPDPGRDMLFEYSAKIVCGRQEDSPGPMQRAAGRYATSVNVHNPLPPSVRFFKKLALTAPPGMQHPGEILPIGEDVLGYDEALQVDCRELRQKLIPTSEASVIEGFLVIQSPTALDVTSVYSTAALGPSEVSGSHSSIDVESIPARRRSASDLLITKTHLPCSEPEPAGADGQFQLGECDLLFRFGDLQYGIQFRLFEVAVFNTGPDPATGIEIDDELRIEFEETSAVGATLIWGEDPIDLPLDAEFVVSQPDVDRSRAEIALPNLGPGESHTLRFWTVSYWVATADDPIDLLNRAEVETGSIDSNPLNDTASASVGLQP